jgi:hypothetical protein
MVGISKSMMLGENNISERHIYIYIVAIKLAMKLSWITLFLRGGYPVLKLTNLTLFTYL